jgi:hypothetical protein
MVFCVSLILKDYFYGDVGGRSPFCPSFFLGRVHLSFKFITISSLKRMDRMGLDRPTIPTSSFSSYKNRALFSYELELEAASGRWGCRRVDPISSLTPKSLPNLLMILRLGLSGGVNPTDQPGRQPSWGHLFNQWNKHVIIGCVPKLVVFVVAACRPGRVGSTFKRAILWYFLIVGSLERWTTPTPTPQYPQTIGKKR